VIYGDNTLRSIQLVTIREIEDFMVDLKTEFGQHYLLTL